MDNVFVALPTYDGSRTNMGAILDLQACLGARAIIGESASSLLANGFNQALAEALNQRKESNIGWFLMLHADVLPLDPHWITLMLTEAARVDAQVLSVVLPIKDNRGLTSTALDTHPWRPRRLTMTEIMDRPVTFTEPGLLINTGCMLVRFDEPWAESLYFTIRDEIRKDAHGRFEAVAEPEDWGFGRQCHRLGLRVFATRVVQALHQGTTGFRNDAVWGWKTDEQNLAYSASNSSATVDLPRMP